MEQLEYKRVYVSASCNQTTNALDWGNNNLICYASCNSICIYNPNYASGGKVTATLVKHTDQVNCVRWIRSPDEPHEEEIVSGGGDNKVIVWKIVNKHVTYHILKCTSKVTIVDGRYAKQNRNKTIVVAASLDHNVLTWLRQSYDDDFSPYYTISENHICMSLRLFYLDHDDKVIMVTSYDNCTVKLYVGDEQEWVLKTNLLGSQDWVRGMDIKQYGEEVLIATSSQDCLIKIWRLKICNPNTNTITDFQIGDTSYVCEMEAVSMGHEGWVHSVAWHPFKTSLLSASWDKTMVIWEYDEDNKLWLDNVRVGEVGGNTLGFFGGVFGPDGDLMLGYGYHGAFHLWKDNGIDWDPMVTVGGHFRPVCDLAWEPDGTYVFSVSTDQTCRIHAPWRQDESLSTWHEIARPQVHGYDMNSIAVLSKYSYASASEEKVIRAFSAPKNFIDNYKQICKIDNKNDEDETKIPKGASVPSLGLSNKAIFGDNNDDQSQLKNKEMYPEESHFSAVDLFEPPTEETLLQNTLWPEIRKLYGHGYEVYCLAASPDGKYLASACKATKIEHAAMLIWDTSNWQQIQKCISHSLTVTQISFSPDSQKILTVSRDRRWTVYEKHDNKFLSSGTIKPTTYHTRIIWCGAWTHDSQNFLTGSRDGKVAMWTKNTLKESTEIIGQYEMVASNILQKDSVTAIAAAPCLIVNKYLFALGLESGIIIFIKWNPRESWEQLLQLDQNKGHHLTVRKIQFRPKLGEAGKEENDNVLQVASCSSDCSLKIFNLYLNKT